MAATLTDNALAVLRARYLVRDNGVVVETPEQLFRRVARAGELYSVAHDHYFTADAVAGLAAIVAELNVDKGAARAADLRDIIYRDGGGGRKVAIHILEFFDRIGYTRRVRDEHYLQKYNVDNFEITPWWKLFDRVIGIKNGTSAAVGKQKLSAVLWCGACGQTHWKKEAGVMQCQHCEKELSITKEGNV